MKDDDDRAAEAFLGLPRGSEIALDREGRFWHRGEPIDYPGLVRAFRRWIAPGHQGRAVLAASSENWCFLKVEDAAIFVDAVRFDDGTATLVLWDGTEEPLDPASLWVDDRGALRCTVRGLSARLSRDAHFRLGERLERGTDGVLRLAPGPIRP